MAEGVFLDPRNTNTVALLRSGPSNAFGLAGISVTAKPGRLYQLSVVNAGATAYYLQVFDKATAPVASDVPIWERRLPASGDVFQSFELAGLYVSLGLGIAISTTPRLLTLAAANDATAYTQHTTAG